jgi:murein DD-endopeptidase MepM/ murein hydrolase activator NlpD
MAAVALVAGGGGLGYWLAVPAMVRTPPSVVVQRPQDCAPFTLEQVGAISGRLFRLESQAAQLSKRIDVFNKETPPSPSPRQERHDPMSAAAPAGASGGPWLPPLPEPANQGALDAQLSHVERQIAWVADAVAQRSLELMRLPTRLPVAGAELTSLFGNRADPFTHAFAFHAGLDFAAPAGTPIVSAAGGTVVFAGFKHDFGWVVEIDHGNGLMTRYAHASELLVRAGQVVTPGERVAMVGSSGRSTGPHLHFEVLRDGTHVDPRRYLAGL